MPQILQPLCLRNILGSFSNQNSSIMFCIHRPMVQVSCSIMIMASVMQWAPYGFMVLLTWRIRPICVLLEGITWDTCLPHGCLHIIHGSSHERESSSPSADLHADTLLINTVTGHLTTMSILSCTKAWWGRKVLLSALYRRGPEAHGGRSDLPGIP